MDKISLGSIPWQDVSRVDYLTALEKAIFALPLNDWTKEVLSVEFPFEDEGNSLSGTILYCMLDKGVIFVNGAEPSDWSNGYDVWLEHTIAFIDKGINDEQIKIAFADVNQYLEKISFDFAVLGHAWLFSYVSQSFENRDIDRITYLNRFLCKP